MSCRHTHRLAVSILGQLHPDLLIQLTQCAKQNACNIIESKLTSIGNECAGSLYFSGSWNAIAKLEVRLPKIASKFNLKIALTRTQEAEPIDALPYKVNILASERIGIVHDLVSFFWQKNISVQYLNCDTFTPRQGCQAMNRVALGILLTAKQNIAVIRDSFMTYCDEKNLDAYFECDYHQG
jgi:glycine cleavage system transcriptional repressor